MLFRRVYANVGFVMDLSAGCGVPAVPFLDPGVQSMATAALPRPSHARRERLPALDALNFFLSAVRDRLWP